MTDEQIRLYAACRVACPSPMIRLRSTTDEQGRLAVIATRPPFKIPLRTEPRVVLPQEGFAPTEPRVEAFEAEQVGLQIHPELLYTYNDGIYVALAERLAESITRSFRRATLNVRL